MGVFAHGKQLTIKPKPRSGGSNIQNQQEHHRKQTFKDEYIEFLRRHDIPYEDRYLLEAEYHGYMLAPLRGGVH